MTKKAEVQNKHGSSLVHNLVLTQKTNCACAQNDYIILRNKMFKDDFLLYRYCKEHGTSVNEKVASSILEYSHEHWEL